MAQIKIQGTAQWAKVFEPDTKYVPEGQYSIKVVMPVEQAAQVCEQLDSMAQAKLEEVVKEQPKLKPLLSTVPAYTTEYDDAGNDTGNVVFNTKLKAVLTRRDGTKVSQKPLVVDAKRTPMDGSVLIGNGSNVKVAIEPYPYMMPATKSVGVSLRMKGVQVIDLVAYGASATSIFDEEDGYVSDAVAKDNNSDIFNEVDGESDVENEGDF